MDNTVLNKKSLNTRTESHDRFVFPRERLMKTKKLWNPPPHPVEDNISNSNWWNRHYVNSVKDCFGIKRNTDTFKPWPCIPRKNRYLSSADSVLDLPSFRYNADCLELLDWSQKNVVVAALGFNYYKWCWHSQKVTGRGRAVHEIQCCKYDPRGDLLLLGTIRTLETHDAEISKRLTMVACKCFTVSVCEITTIDWSPTGQSYVTGCSLGRISAYSRDSLLMADSFVYKANGERDIVFSARISPDARCVAVAPIDSSEILIFSWPNLTVMQRFIVANTYTTALCWHPWQGALLARAGVNKDNNVVLNICRGHAGDYSHYTPSDMTMSCVDSMLFSPITGELTLSIFNKELGLWYPQNAAYLQVLSDCSTVADDNHAANLAIHRFQNMVFSPDGTKLATATSDEDLIIWNFLPSPKRKTKVSKFYQIPAYLDYLTLGTVLR